MCCGNVDPTFDFRGLLCKTFADSVTRLGDFWKFLALNLFSKVAQKDFWLLGYFEKDQLM